MFSRLYEPNVLIATGINEPCTFSNSSAWLTAAVPCRGSLARKRVPRSYYLLLRCPDITPLARRGLGNPIMNITQSPARDPPDF